jgi:hypothetical protein
MKDYTNYPNWLKAAPSLRLPPKGQSKIKNEIDLRLCFAPLLVVSAFGVLGWSYLLLTERLVMN